MVYYFVSKVVDPPAFIYMGKDKYENEELIKYGWPEDIWFHVDKLSSAHVYLRLPEGQTMEDISDELLTDCCQLVKANSIEGNKKGNIGIVYTPWDNLKKTGDMAVGQVSFHNPKKVKRCKVEKRVNEIVNRLNKTKEEKFPDLPTEQAERTQRDAAKKKAEAARIAAIEKEKAAEAQKEREARSYDLLMKEENMTSNAAYGDDVDYEAIEDDFM